MLRSRHVLLAIVILVLVAVFVTGCPAAFDRVFPFFPVEQRLSVVAKKYEFIPATLKVRKGRKVVMRIRSADDLSYGVHVPELGLRTTVPAGKQSELKFTPGRRGTFLIRCGPPTRGPGCKNMRATLQVR